MVGGDQFDPEILWPADPGRDNVDGGGDIGGGTGTYAAWIADRGYDLDLVDVVPGHVEQPREISRRLQRGFSAHVGDARR
jgi:hypothetical protein